jgi:glycosyltransferase involved in cell wall biosynthesis
VAALTFSYEYLRFFLYKHTNSRVSPHSFEENSLWQGYLLHLHHRSGHHYKHLHATTRCWVWVRIILLHNIQEQIQRYALLCISLLFEYIFLFNCYYYKLLIFSYQNCHNLVKIHLTPRSLSWFNFNFNNVNYRFLLQLHFQLVKLGIPGLMEAIINVSCPCHYLHIRWSYIVLLVLLKKSNSWCY